MREDKNGTCQYSYKMALKLEYIAVKATSLEFVKFVQIK
jgi:hypothetical protein